MAELNEKGNLIDIAILNASAFIHDCYFLTLKKSKMLKLKFSFVFKAKLSCCRLRATNLLI